MYAARPDRKAHACERSRRAVALGNIPCDYGGTRRFHHGFVRGHGFARRRCLYLPIFTSGLSPTSAMFALSAQTAWPFCAPVGSAVPLARWSNSTFTV